MGLQANIHVWLSHGTISIAYAAEPGGGGGGGGSVGACAPTLFYSGS